MGTEEKEWTDVANDLLTKCHIILKVKNLTECDANVFVALYEAILGEKVPDFISPSRSQEANAHNVQAIIDSLALDYLQVSLSHITGENIVKGEKESIKNLLEIFDGLLEYLTEQISEASSQPGDDVLQRPRDVHERALQVELSQRQKDIVSVIKIPSTVASSTESSDIPILSWEVEGSESTGELIRLGETAHTFTLRKSVVPEFVRTANSADNPPILKTTRVQGEVKESYESSSLTSGHRRELPSKHPHGQLYNNAFPEDGLISKVQMFGEPIRSAIPLQPPYQPMQHRPKTLIGRAGSHLSSITISQPLIKNHRPTEPTGNESSRIVPAAVPQATATLTQTSTAMPQTDVAVPPSSLQGPTIEDEALVTRHSKRGQHCMNEVEQNDTAREEPVSNVPKKVAFRTLPDIRFMTFQNNLVEKEDWQSIGEGTTLEESQMRFSADEQQTSPASETSVLNSHNHRKDNTTSFPEASLSCKRAENRLSEQELHEMSENLARKLNELDLMLKQALGERAKEDDFREEDKLSQHSDSFMEYRKKKHLPGSAQYRKNVNRPRSLSSSPPLVNPPTRYSLHTQFEDALNKDAKGQMKSVRREIQKELDQQRTKAKLVTNAYEEEIKSYEHKERIKISKQKEKLKEKEQEYKENIFQHLPKTPQPAKAYSRKASPQKPRQSQSFSSGGAMQPRKATPMKIKENDLLPLLLDEFPYLHISPHVMNKMWKQQFSQLEQLTKSASGEDRSRAKLQNEVEVVQKKHDLLVELIRKEQEHNQRLHEFKERIRHQKSTQNKMREKRQQIARAKKYYEDYHVQLRAKMMRAKTREELIFKHLVEEGLEIQKERLRDIRLYAKEKREEQSKRHKDELESMENYYKDQFSMVAEAVSQERHEIQVREKAQENTLSKMKRGLRAKMEKEIRELQDMITKNDDDTFFRELEAERLKRRIQMASFQYSKSHLL